MGEIAIKAENLSKIYKLYNKPVDRVKEALNPFGKYYREFYALNDVSFNLERGQTLGVIGKNGSGKSTLLKILTGVLTPSGGTLEVNGRISSLLELGSGFNPELTGLENIYFYGAINGLSRQQMDGKVEQIISFAEIGQFINQPVKTYSSGMFVRLAFAAAINIDPDILIIDEALSVGDMRFQKKCLAKIDEFRESGKTILFCSHDMHSVSELCDSVIWLKDGKVEKSGSSNEVIAFFVAEMTDAGGQDQSAVVLGNSHFYVKNSEEVEIHWLKAYDSNGIEKYLFFTGEDIVLKMKFSASNGINDPKYSLIILKDDGTPVALTKSNYYKNLETQGIVKGEFIAKVTLPNIGFNTGKYIFGMSVWDKSGSLSFASNRKTMIEVKSLNITFGPMEERTVFFPCAEWESASIFSGRDDRTTANINCWEEFEKALSTLSIDKNDICVVGSTVLALKGIKENNDIDIIVRQNVRSRLSFEGGAFQIADGIEVVGKQWGWQLGLSDEKLLDDTKYHFIFEGYKIVRPEVLYSRKRLSGRDKDTLDADLIEEKIPEIKDWDQSLVCLSPQPFVINCPVANLLSAQYQESVFGRIDIIVRLLAIENYFGLNSIGFDLYNKMQKQRVGIEDGDKSFRTIIEKFASHPIIDRPIEADLRFNLFDGSHRTSLALFFGIPEIQVKIINHSFVSEYGIDWFKKNGFNESEIKQIEQKKDELLKREGLYFYAILWPPVAKYFNEITKSLGLSYRIIETYDFDLEDNFNEVVYQIYAVDDIAEWKVEKKIKVMQQYPKCTRVVCFEIPDPKFRKKALNNKDISSVVEEIKSHYRQMYSEKISNYFHDIIIHIGDNFEHNKTMHQIIEQLTEKGKVVDQRIS